MTNEVFAHSQKIADFCFVKEEKHTWADDPGVLMMAAVMTLPSRGCNSWPDCPPVRYSSRYPANPSRAVAEVSVCRCTDSQSAADLLTHDCGVRHAPVIITHRSPAALIVDLHPALTAVPCPRQTYRSVSYSTGRSDVGLGMMTGRYKSRHIIIQIKFL